MWLKSAVFLLLAISSVKSQQISCNYVERGGFPYTCQLTIDNPEGSDAFTTIPGQHLPNRTDADVQVVDAFSQNSLNIPQIICQQFPNVVDLYFAVSNVQIIQESSFSGCTNLRSAILIYNAIHTVPANTFRNNPNLEFIYLSWNNVSELTTQSFTGSRANFIDLEFNNLGAMPGGLFRGTWFEGVNTTLQSLGIMGNNLRGIEVNGFANLRNLAWLDMTANPLFSVTDSAFNGLVSIRDLFLIQCELNNLRPAWFRDMRMLEELHIELNGISNLPNGVFENLDAITNLYLGYNNLTQITLAPFGEASFNIEVLSLTQNQVNAIEPVLWDNLENLNSIEMGGNVCNQLNLFNIQQDREMSRARLRRCFDNFGPRFANCAYMPISGEYSCSLTIRNAEGVDFVRINGTHLSERVDEDVQMIYGANQNTRNFPPVICRQFPAVTTILMYSSYIEIITPDAFENCQLLAFLNLDFNIITQVPDNTFSRSPLRELYLGGNLISSVDFFAFNGTQLEFIDLSNNQMYEFNPVVFEPINRTLMTLDLMNNRLGILYSQHFANLRNIEYLILSGNQFYTIPEDAFDGAIRLEYLAMSNCGLRSLNPRWFESKPDLEVLYLGSNQLTDIPDGSFEPLTDLKELYVYNNQLLELRAAQFGRSLRDIEVIYAIGNRINSIDPVIVTTAPDLEYLFLQNNLCVNLNFYNVYDDPQFVLERIQSCNQNFAAVPAVSCNYVQRGADYICELTIVNPLGAEFESIGGSHLADMNDADVFVVEINDQNTLNLPSVVCTQFPGIRRLQILNSATNVLSREAFANCSNLEHILIMRNNIPEILGGTFSNSPNLRVAVFPFNNIRSISSTAFEGTRLENLDLEFNELNLIDYAWFTPIQQTIRVFRINDNRLNNLHIDSFIRLWNLRELYLNNNPLGSLRYRIFEPMINVEVLQLAGCGLTEMDPNWFERNPMIVNLELDNNRFRDLPVGVFNNTPRLVHLGLTGNELRAIDSLSFGNSLNTLRSLHIDLNNIEAFDEFVLDNTPSLDALIAYQNGCIDGSYLGVNQNRDRVRESLANCISGYNNITASCEYEVYEGMYKCNFHINNPQGRHRFERITGEHIENSNDNYVTYVEAVDQFTKTIPSIICEQFQYIEGITFTASNVEFIAENTFAHCEFLYSLNLMMNNIRIVPPVAFRQNNYLASLRLDGNRIANLPVEIFYGTQIYNLHLSGNQITSITRQHFEPIARNLIFLDLRQNQITNLPRGVFAGMGMLYWLELDGNNLRTIPSDTFHSMQYLGFLNLANCGLTTITARHFQEKPILYQLEIDNNRLTYLPPNVFSMPSLENLGLNGNQLEFIDSTSFGASLQSLVHIGATENRIRGIDERMITRIIDAFDLFGNDCANTNLGDIQNNRDNILQYLQSCFVNFRRRNDVLRCEYAHEYDDYVCWLTISNEDAHIQFSEVEGTHLIGQGNNDVTRIVALDQHAPRFPPIVCQQFPNARDLVIRNSSLFSISAATFTSCRSLRYLNLNFNDLTFLPALSFPASLDYLSLYNNRIRDISFNAFTGSNITTLDLNFNRIDQTYVEIFWPINATLQNLYIEYNLMYYLPNNGLANLRNLRAVDLSGNDFSDPLSLPSSGFTGGSNMELLSLTDVGLSHLDHQWFEDMPNLTNLYLYNNRLFFLPLGIFSPLTNIQALHLQSNYLTELRISSFGPSLRNVFYFYAMANQINGIQNEFVDELQSAQWLMLSENQCVDNIFVDVVNNREMVRTALADCIASFRAPSISCSYFGGDPDTEYFCIMDIHNPDGVALNAIEGEHVSGQTNNDVVSVNAFYQNTREIPNVVCRQFANLERMMITGSGIEVILPENLEGCGNLQELYVHINRIRTIPAGTFVNTPALRLLELGYNQISTIENGAFRGTSLDMLDLYNNRITDFTPSIFEGVTNLTYVDLSFNWLTGIPENAFSSLTNLRDLTIASNQLNDNIPPSAFAGLRNLRTLGLSRTSTRVLNQGWFTDLTSLEEVYLNNNILREINSTVFAPIMPTIRSIYLNYNFITMIDQVLLLDDSTPNLEYLMLRGNLCTDEDFLNVQTSRWRIFEALMTCSNNFYEQPWLSCSYSSSDDDYICQISILNPRGFNFDQIDGQHLQGRNASDVTDILGLFQSTRNIPPVLCQTFTNLRTIRMWYSGVEEINADSLRECRNLEMLDLQMNWIWRIDSGSFLGTRSLRHLELSNNRLSTLPFDAFQNAPLEFLDLAFNQLNEFNHWHFTSAAPTITTLILMGNQITQIRPMSFLNFENLQRLLLSYNPLFDVPRDAFNFLNNLYDLYLANTGISRLDPEWFHNLPALEELHINGNNIRELPEGIFSSSLRLRELHVYNNQIRSLSANQFGQLQTLTHILAQNNRIRAMDPEIINRARNLEWLMLSGNICNNDDFSNVQGNRQQVIERLSTCFLNAGPERLICTYRFFEPDYICSLNIFNPLGREQFNEVEGEHMEDRTNSDVTSLYGSYANTLNFPVTICQQFPNLIEISMLSTGIEYIDSSSFADCERLVNLQLHANLIQNLGNFVFINNPLLETFSIERNGLSWIGPFAFFGTSLVHLDVANNPLEDFDPNWTSNNGDTLRELNLMNTGLTGLQVGAFDLTPNLRSLILANNRLVDIPQSTFAPLTRLETLVLGNTNLVGLNPEWFQNLQTLRSLNLQGNNLFELPAGIFEPLSNLTNLYIYQNNIRDLDVASFGSSLRSIDTLSAQYNQIMGIDPSFIDEATNLNILYLSGNNCSSENFYEVQQTRANVSAALNQCFTNFAAEFLTCTYYVTEFGDYACRLNISNPIGRDAFTVIPGQHLEGRTNDDVTLIDFMNQNTRNIPAIICEQFPSIKTLIAWGSNIDLITPRSFAGCTQLENLNLFVNNIENIPPNTFANNPLLSYLELGGNRLQSFTNQSFEGSAIEFLDLANNLISEFDPNWFAPINATLRTLDLLSNQISSLPADAFRSLRDLEILILSNNPLRGENIPGNAFIALDNLQMLSIGNSQLGTLNPNWFTALRNLNILGLYNAGIEILPNNIFNPLVNIDSINLSDNFIWEINNDQFGLSLETLRALTLNNNVVNMIDASMVTSATNLYYLMLRGNVCSDEDFRNVADYLWVTLEYLQQCTDNFVQNSTINCQYGNLNDMYMCTLASHNPRGFDGFASIAGDHLEGLANENVAMIYSNGANMRNIPSIICEQFPNTWEMMFVESNIEQLSEAAFRNCANLQYVFILGNLIRSIPDNTFANSPNMIYLSVNVNRISHIGPNAFRGTRIETLDLANNRIAVFDPRSYEAINGTLRTLDLMNNQLNGFPYAAFENVAGITTLVLNGNHLNALPFEFLFPLWDLQILSMANCQLTELHHTWFFDSINLQQLYVQRNLLTEFQDGVFHNMTSLELVYFYDNQIRDLRSISFGMSIPSLRVLRGDSNAINAIDPALIEDAVSLEYLLLPENQCVDDSFFNVRDNLADVQTALQGCFNNFEQSTEVF